MKDWGSFGWGLLAGVGGMILAGFIFDMVMLEKTKVYYVNIPGVGNGQVITNS